MATRESYSFIISAEHRRDFGFELAPGAEVVATLLQQPRAQMTPEERTVLGGGGVHYQWGLGIGANQCNLLYAMHRAIDGSFSPAQLAVQIKTNPGQSTHEECGSNNYSDSEILYSGPDLGVLVIARSTDGASLIIRAYDMTGSTVLVEDHVAPVPDHWLGKCNVFLRGDNCLAGGVVTG